jgi:hypothetical protein
MKFTFQTRDRRALILLASALGLYFLVSGVVFPAYDDLAAAETSAIEKEDQLLRYRRALVRSADYAALLEEARGRIQDGEALLIPGDNPSLASAQLQTLIEEVAERTGIELGQRNISPARPADDYFDEITMSLTFECTPGQLVRFLSEIRNVERIVVVRSIQVSPLQGADGVPAGDLIKDLAVNVSFAAILAPPTVADAGEVSDEG